MGLPLFAHLTETDVPRKSDAKAGSASPLQAGIRRVYRDDSRDRRNTTRRAAVRLYGDDSLSSPFAPADPTLPWIDSNRIRVRGHRVHAPEPPHSFHQPGRQSLRDLGRVESRRRERVDEHMNTLFTNTLHDSLQTRFRDDDRYEGDLGWWSIEAGQRARRARMLSPSRPIRTQQATDPASSSRQRQEAATREVEAARLRAVSSVGSHPLRNSQRRSATAGSSRSRMSRENRARGLDGLGDRERSVSPEGWDTLLSTLTPDPQPPSANSSFAAGLPPMQTTQTSLRPLDNPASTAMAVAVAAGANAGMAPDGLIDGPCDSGWENSDVEDADIGQREYARLRGRREGTQSRAAAPYYDLDLLADTDRDVGFGLRVIGGDMRQPRTASQSRTQRDAGANDTQETQANNSSLSLTDADAQRDGWIGRVLIGVAEDVDSQSTTQGRSDATSATLQPSSVTEEDWAGMQRIVRNLVHREDIPDEWWAEAGLSRTLPPENAN